MLNPFKIKRLSSIKNLLFGVSMCCLAAFLLAGCARRANIQGKGTSFMQGEWNEDSVAFSSKLKTFTQHRFKFTCDSFYVDLTTDSKVNFYEDSCYNGGVWKEYAKGVYGIKNDTLALGGTFTHENYKQKLTGCYRIGRYEKTFIIKKVDSNVIILVGTADQREITLNLKNKITCIQKAL